MKKIFIILTILAFICYAGGKSGQQSGGTNQKGGNTQQQGGSQKQEQQSGKQEQGSDSSSWNSGESKGTQQGGSSYQESGKSSHDSGTTVSSYSNENYTYESGTFTFNQDMVWIDFNRRIDLLNEASSSISVNDIATMGYYNINEDGSTGEYVELYNKGENTEATVIFKKDQTIGIYMDINGKRYTTTSTSDSSTTGGTNIDPDSVDEANQYFCLFTQGTVTGGAAHYEYYFDGMESSSDSIEAFIEDIQQKYGEDLTIIVDGKKYEPVGTNGQPLPGVIATVLVGAGCGVLLRKKKLNRKKSLKF